MLKGFIIFLMATAWLVSWSFAELGSRLVGGGGLKLGSDVPDETKGSHADGLQVGVPLGEKSVSGESVVRGISRTCS